MFPGFPDHSSFAHYYSTVFDICDRMVCINITLFDDDILDNVDVIIVDLYTYPSLISYNGYFLIIEVQDDDDGE